MEGSAAVSAGCPAGSLPAARLESREVEARVQVSGRRPAGGWRYQHGQPAGTVAKLTHSAFEPFKIRYTQML